MQKAIFVIKIIYTLLLVVFGIVAYNVGNTIYHYPKPELSPDWSFFGTSDWSVYITYFYISYLYLILNALSYLIKLIKGPLEILNSPLLSKRLLSVFRSISTLLLLGYGFLAFLALTDIWHGYEPDISMEWTFMHVYSYLFYSYLFLSVVDICIKSATPHKLIKPASA